SKASTWPQAWHLNSFMAISWSGCRTSAPGQEHQELAEKTAKPGDAPTRAELCGFGFQSVAPAMFQVGRFVAGDQSDDAGPKPGRRVQALRRVAADLRAPFPARLLIHLTPVRHADDGRKESRRLHRFLSRETVNFQLEVLRQQL